MNKSIALTLMAATLALSGGLFVQQTFGDVKQIPLDTAQIEFSLPDSNKKQQAVSLWRGKFVVINFWATWCAPCLKEIPEFIKMQNEYQSRGVQFVGVAIDDHESVNNYLETIESNYPQLVAGDGGIALAKQLGNTANAVPFTIILNQAGQIAHRHTGELSRNELIAILSSFV